MNRKFISLNQKNENTQNVLFIFSYIRSLENISAQNIFY